MIGHSEGGLIAFILGAQKKTDFIISLAGPGVKGDTLSVVQSNLMLERSGIDPKLAVKMTVRKLRQDPQFQKLRWYQWFFDYDPSDNIRKTRCPVFALNGDHDCQVVSSQNLTAIKQLLPKSKKNLIKEYPMLNHLFQHCTTGLPNEYGQIEETFSEEVLNDIIAWIKKLAEKNKKNEDIF